MNSHSPFSFLVPHSSRDKNGRESTRRSLWEGWRSFVIALFVVLLIRHFIAQPYRIPSGSMIPTLLIGDQLIATKSSFGIRLPFQHKKLVRFSPPEHGEIIVFLFPDDPSKEFVKRTIALPGERIKIREGVIFVNDQAIPRRYLGVYEYETSDGSIYSAEMFEEKWGKNTYRVLYSRDGFHAFWNMEERRLGEDEIFVMGDNRDRSNDSRFWGPVKLDLLEGRPLIIHFSMGPHFKIRWDRMFRPVK